MKQYNFSEPEGGDQSQGWALLSVTWAFVLCATITTLLRVWVRARLTRNMGADDWTIVAALVRAKWFHIAVSGDQTDHVCSSPPSLVPA